LSLLQNWSKWSSGSSDDLLIQQTVQALQTTRLTEQEEMNSINSCGEETFESHIRFLKRENIKWQNSKSSLR